MGATCWSFKVEYVRQIRRKMKKKNKAKMILLVSAVVIEFAGVILLSKAYATHSSPTTGLTFIIIGLMFLIIGITRKSENGNSESN